jgi:uncharacterized protein (DUF2252 family)
MASPVEMEVSEWKEREGRICERRSAVHQEVEPDLERTMRYVPVDIGSAWE